LYGTNSRDGLKRDYLTNYLSKDDDILQNYSIFKGLSGDINFIVGSLLVAEILIFKDYFVIVLLGKMYDTDLCRPVTIVVILVLGQ
jgi:hypothetical protein